LRKTLHQTGAFNYSSSSGRAGTRNQPSDATALAVFGSFYHDPFPECLSLQILDRNVCAFAMLVRDAVLSYEAQQSLGCQFSPQTPA
jgi:hypothetical protein